MFFKKFSKISYSFIDEPDNPQQVTNILSAFYLKKMLFNKSLIFQKYTAKDEDIPEFVSDKLYSTAEYYWVFLIINDIINPYTEWCMRSDILDAFVEQKYKNGIQFKKTDGTIKTLLRSDGANGIHHFYNLIDNRMCDDVEDEYYREKWNRDPTSIGSNIIPITNHQYEYDVNFEKRKLTILNPGNIERFIEDFNNMLAGTQDIEQLFIDPKN